MDRIVVPLRRAFEREDGYALAEVISPLPPADDAGRLYSIQRAVNSFSIQPELRSALKSIFPDHEEKDSWIDILTHYWKSITDLLAAEEIATANTNGAPHQTPDWTRVYTSWKDLLNSLHRSYSHSLLEPWTIPILYTAAKHLRRFALLADSTLTFSSLNAATSGLDDITTSDPTSSHPNLEDCARQINRIFALVSQDRSPPPNRKYGTYYIAILLFKTYFRLNSISLCKNIIRSINAASADMSTLR